MMLCRKVLVAVTIIFSVLCPAQAVQQKNDTSDVPEVIVLIMSFGGPQDRVSFTYASPVTKEQIEEHIAALKAATGWPLSDVKISTGSVQVGGEDPLTCAEFSAPFTVNRSTGSVLVEPFLIAFRDFKFVEIDYLIQGEFTFRALRDFSNDYVDISCERSGNSMRYRAWIEDNSFEQLNLPLVMEENVREQEAENNRSRSRGLTVLKVMAAIGIAVIIGSAVYVLSSRFSGLKE